VIRADHSDIAAFLEASKAAEDRANEERDLPEAAADYLIGISSSIATPPEDEDL